MFHDLSLLLRNKSTFEKEYEKNKQTNKHTTQIAKYKSKTKGKCWKNSRAQTHMAKKLQLKRMCTKAGMQLFLS